MLETAKDGLELPSDEIDGWCFSIQRTFADAQSELERTRDAKVVRGAHPPISATEQLDFKNLTIDELAQYVLKNFSPGGDDHQENSIATSKNPIDDRYFLIMDERTASDRTVLIVQIPTQGQENDQGVMVWTRNWVKRDSYNGFAHWEDDMFDNEMKAARVAFSMARHVEMMKEQLGAIGSIENAYEYAEEDGVSQT